MAATSSSSKKGTSRAAPATAGRFPELAAFLNERAIRRGTFTLASGKTSNFYCDAKAAVLHGRGASLIAAAVVETLEGVEFDAVGGMELGAVPITAAVIQRFHDSQSRDVPGFIVRKAVKEYGTQKRIEGPGLGSAPGAGTGAGARVVIVEDVVTTGGSVLSAIDAVQSEGHEVVLVISVLDREEGGREAIESRGVAYRPLVTLSELGL